MRFIYWLAEIYYSGALNGEEDIPACYYVIEKIGASDIFGCSLAISVW